MRERRAAREASDRRIADAKAATQAAVASGICPECGNSIYRNMAMAGWYQCDGYPARSHRRPGHMSDPKCDWQGFTE